MKKNISINISGIIFHIEEDGYDLLKNYLESVNRYFASYDERMEIIADIEGRIAEIFLAKLSGNKQVISAGDVEALIATMGTIQDFEAVEEEDVHSKAETKQAYQQASDAHAIPERKLYRDVNRKLLGGVAAGIANYFAMDPLWIRLIFVVLAFSSFIFWFDFGTFSGATFIVYIVLWIVLPASAVLEESKKIKKLYRNPDDRIIGGVSSGIAAYFGTDVTWIRLLFVITIFLGGSGLVVYIVLWIITPEAKTLTDKMQMQGEPVTLSNIETNVKRSLNVSEGEESPLVKVLLFPFRLIAIVFNALIKVLGPIALFLVEAVRIIAGVFLISMSLVFLFSLFIAAGALLGLTIGDNYINFFDAPVNLLRDTLPPFAILVSFVAIFIPLLISLLLGVAVVAKRKIVSATVAWSFFAVWVISIIGVGATIPAIISDFSRDADVEVAENYDLQGKTAVLTLREIGMDNYQGASLQLLGHSSADYRLVKSFEGRGRTRQMALENAEKVSYGVSLKDSVFIFDSNITFNENADFRAQEVDAILYIPYDAVFMMDEDLKYILINTLHVNGYQERHIRNNSWRFTEDGLECITCEEKPDERNLGGDEIAENISGYHKEFYVDDFHSLDIGGFYDVEVTQGENCKITIAGEERDIDDIKISNNSGELEVSMDYESFQIFGRNRKKITVYITMPNLENFDLSGASKATVTGFTGENMDLDVSGASRLDVEVNIRSLKVSLSGASQMNLQGEGTLLTADLSGACSLEAYEYKVDDANVEASGASNAKVFARRNVNYTASGASSVNTMGGGK